MLVANDNEGRFIVRQGAIYGDPDRRSIRRTGWYVYRTDSTTGDLPITIGFRSEEEAIHRRDRIAELYARFGW